MNDMSFIAEANANYMAQQGTKAPRVPKGADEARLRQVAEDFESMFLTQMMQPMMAEIGKDDPFAGPGQDIWRSMQATEYGKAMTRAGGIGIADAVLSEMIKLQEGR